MQSDAARTEARKSRHLDIVLEDDVTSRRDAGFAALRLHHEALPDFAYAEVETATTFLGFPLRAPLVISSMTGGTERAGAINRNLAVAAAERGIALALGSQRAALENAALVPTYDVRASAPGIVLFANLGAVQLNYGLRLDDVRRAVADVAADGLYLHLNPLQEALQAGGDTNFAGLEAKIAAVCAGLEVPVIAKGVGSGLSPATARRLLAAGVKAIDVAGAGGTSWALVEGRRADDPTRERIAESFGAWGYGTVEATVAMRETFAGLSLVASGGITSGIEVAKALAVGADLAGIGRPLLAPATESAEAVIAALDEILAGLRIAMFASGSRRIADLPAALLRPLEGPRR